EWPETWYYTTPGIHARADLLRSLQSSGERHLILVRYSENHIPDDEWVYNDADIDNARVVWARDMGTAANRELVRYFGGRQVWILEPDHLPQALHKYTDASDTPAPASEVSVAISPASAGSR